jgi:hypothetical protein
MDYQALRVGHLLVFPLAFLIHQTFPLTQHLLMQRMCQHFWHPILKGLRLGKPDSLLVPSRDHIRRYHYHPTRRRNATKRRRNFSQQKLFDGLHIMMVLTGKLVGWQNQVSAGCFG